MSHVNPKIQEELDFINSRIKEEEYKAKQHEYVQELFATDSFKSLILEDYMEGEAARLTGAITTPDGMKREHIETAMEKLVSIRHLRAFLARVEMDAMHAQDNLEEYKATRDEIKANPEKYIDTEED